MSKIPLKEKKEKVLIQGQAQNITSLQNEKVKNVVKLRQRAHRDKQGLLIVEGERELQRALENNRRPLSLFYCRDFFTGKNEAALVSQCRAAGAEIISCAPRVFAKMAYREKPGGLLALVPLVKCDLSGLKLAAVPLLVIAEAIEKPGNLGTMLRSADAAGADAVIVCDRCTDINNPNVVRASIGAIFTVPVVETSSAEAIKWLHEKKIKILAASPHAALEYTQADLRRGTALVVGEEKQGLSELWIKTADLQVRIPMRGRIDSLNVAAATTVLLFEAARQRNGYKSVIPG
ncbi:MAG: RNA methyltransferase [Kiritimatiellia bacterium]|nr:RNA methyltransferase [Kiritimatiellia bacterium]